MMALLHGRESASCGDTQTELRCHPCQVPLSLAPIALVSVLNASPRTYSMDLAVGALPLPWRVGTL